MDYDESQEETQFELLIEGLIDDNYGCCDDFIQPDTATGLRANIQRLNESGDMVSSGMGNKAVFRKDKNIRGDKICWIADQSQNHFELIYTEKINRLIIYLNKTCFTSINNSESHYSVYEISNFYKRHLDQFKSEKGRKYSMVLYLNQDWKEEDGGMLSMYPKDAEQINLYPLGGRMVFFRSDEMEHEVHASLTRDRKSIVGWLKN